MKIIEQLLKLEGLFAKLYGNDVYYNYIKDKKERTIKRLIKEVYGYQDIEYIFDDIIEDHKVQKISEIAFRFQNENDEKKGLFSK